MLLKKRPENDRCWAGDWKLGATKSVLLAFRQKQYRTQVSMESRSGAHVLLSPTKVPCAYGLRRVSKRNQTATSVERGSSCMARTILRDAQRGLLIRMPPMYSGKQRRHKSLDTVPYFCHGRLAFQPFSATG
ncbi:hypothetical protein KC367_g141 [Hortaea werneckii]|nr:hypothetical protein KC367_g141 [Hortaea werneckii]